MKEDKKTPEYLFVESYRAKLEPDKSENIKESSFALSNFVKEYSNLGSIIFFVFGLIASTLMLPFPTCPLSKLKFSDVSPTPP